MTARVATFLPRPAGGVSPPSSCAVVVAFALAALGLGLVRRNQPLGVGLGVSALLMGGMGSCLSGRCGEPELRVDPFQGEGGGRASAVAQQAIPVSTAPLVAGALVPEFVPRGCRYFHKELPRPVLKATPFFVADRGSVQYLFFDNELREHIPAVQLIVLASDYPQRTHPLSVSAIQVMTKKAWTAWRSAYRQQAG
jgi:hypothetical protein